MERLGDESFADTGTVRVCSIDKANASLHRPPQQRDRLALIPRRAPDPPAGDAHCAKANLTYWQLGNGCLGYHLGPLISLRWICDAKDRCCHPRHARLA